MLRWMETSQDILLKSTAGCIPTQLNCPVVIEDAESSVNRLLALVHAFLTGPISQTAWMEIVEERHQPPVESLHDAIFHCMPCFSIGTTYIVAISGIEAPIHVLLLMLQPDSMWSYLINMIDLDDTSLYDI